jgi:hypothetical protein
MTELEDLEHQLQCLTEERQALGLQISKEPFCSKAQLNIKKCRDINKAETEMYFRVLKLK